MDPVFRPASCDADIDAWADLSVDSFAVPAERAREYCRYYPRDDVHVAVTAGPAGERVVGALGLCAASRRWGGRDVPMDGLAAVCTAPDARGHGVATGLVTAALAASRARGRPLATLYPASLALYRKCGYEVAGAVTRLRLRLELLPRAPLPAGVTVRPATRREIQAGSSGARAAQGNLVGREAFFWNRVFRAQDEPRALGLFATDGGGDEIIGGVVMTRSLVERGRHDINLKHWWAVDERALAALLAVLGNQGSLGRWASWLGAPTDRLVMALPAEVWEVERVQPWMLRVVDLAAAFEARGFPQGLSAEIDLGVDDASAPWNTGRWHVAVANGAATVTRAADRPDGAALRVDALGLARLYAGVVPFEHGLCAGPAAWLDEAF